MRTDAFIEKLGLERAKVMEDEIHCRCPFPERHLKGKDTTPSFSVNFEKGVYNCFACGSRGTIENLVASVCEVSLSQAVDVLEELGFSKLDIEIEKWVKEEAEEVILPEELLKNYTRLDEPYEMYNGLVDFGSLGKKECTIYVVRDLDGNLVGGNARSKEGRFHKIMWHMLKKYYLCGAQDVDKEQEVVVVEGPKDMLAIKKSGYNNAVALMGSELSEHHVKGLLRLASTFVVWADKDDAGRKLIGEFVERLEPLADVRYVNPWTALTEGENDVYNVYEGRGTEAVISTIAGAQTLLELELEMQNDSTVS